MARWHRFADPRGGGFRRVAANLSIRRSGFYRVSAVGVGVGLVVGAMGSDTEHLAHAEGALSLMGQKLTYALQQTMSALPRKADICGSE